MSTIVICNVGARDISDPQKDRQTAARAHGRQLLDDFADNFTAVQARLTLPIIQPALDEILARESNGIDHLVLLGTDQDVNSSFHHTDTLHYAEVARRLVLARQPEQIRTATCRTIRGINPSHYDEAFAFYGRLLPEIIAEGDPHPDCYLLAAGGIPACNTSLLLQGVRFLGEQCTAVYTAPDATVTFFQIGRHLLAAMRENSLVTLVSRHHYAAAATLAQATSSQPIEDLMLWQNSQTILQQLVASQAGENQQKLMGIMQELRQMASILAPLPVSATAIRLMQAAAARLHGDYASAADYLDNLPPDAASETVDLQTTCQRLAQGDDACLELIELAFQSDILQAQGYAADCQRRAIAYARVALKYLAAMYQWGPLDTPLSDLLAALDAAVASPNPPLTPEHFTHLRQALENTFNLEELHTLALDLDINPDNIEGGTLKSRAANLVDYTKRHGRMTDLLALCRHKRPNSSLSQLPVITAEVAAALRQLAAAETKLNAMQTVNNALALAANNPYTALQTAILKHLESAHE